MKFVYVVMGSTGEYSDHKEWPVRAFLDEQAAKDLVLAAAAAYRKLRQEKEARESYSDEPFPYSPMGTNPHDPNMQCDYTGVNYQILKVELGPPEKPKRHSSKNPNGIRIPGCHCTLRHAYDCPAWKSGRK